MFNNSKYTTYYYSIINAAKENPYNGYTENHHIIPKSLGGSNEPDNIAVLSARQHFICHWLLTKMLDGHNKSKMCYALQRLCFGKHYKNNMTSRVYESLKNQYKDFHWSNHKTEGEVRQIYEKRGNRSDNFSGARAWIDSLSDDKRKEFYKKQGESRCKGWWISKIDEPEKEEFVLNLHEWCKKIGADNGHASKISNPNRKEYGKSVKGHRIRKDGNPPLPKYVDGRSSRYIDK